MRVKTASLVICLLIALIALDSAIGPGSGIPPAGDSVAFALLGEFRTVAANLLWIKVETYHHEFIAHGGDWAKNGDVLALNRIITRLDPHFEEAYEVGSRILVGTGKPDEARNYLADGIKSNPNSMSLHDEMATVLAIHLKDYKGALYHFKRAYCLARDDFDHKRLKRLIHTTERIIKTGDAPRI